MGEGRKNPKYPPKNNSPKKGSSQLSRKEERSEETPSWQQPKVFSEAQRKFVTWFKFSK